MRALIFDQELKFSRDYPEPIRAADQATLRIKCAGICNTDLELARGYMGFSGVLGHEFVAEVIEGSPAVLGRRVVGEINVADGVCEFCRRGIPSQCSNRTTVGIDRHDGGFAELLALSERNLHIIPDTISDDSAIFVEPLAAALQILEAVHVSPRERVVVLGAGKLGLLVSQVLKLTGADLVVVVRRQKQAKLLDSWGIPYATSELLSASSADIVIDCTGSPDGFSACVNLVRPRGKLVLKSTYEGRLPVDLTSIAVNEIQVIGSRCGPFEAALRLLGYGLIDVESMVEARYSIEDGIAAFEHAAQPGTLKVILDIRT